MALDLDIHLCDALNTCFAVASDVRSIPPCAVSAALLRVSEARVPLAPLETGHIPTADALLNSYEPRVACVEDLLRRFAPPPRREERAEAAAAAAAAGRIQRFLRRRWARRRRAIAWWRTLTVGLPAARALASARAAAQAAAQAWAANRV